MDVYPFGYRLPRFHTDFHLCLQVEEIHSGLLHGLCTDISEHGLRAQVQHTLPIGSAVTLIMSLPGSQAVRITARILSRQHDSYGFGFVFSSDQQRECIRRYIDSLSSPTVTRARR